MYKILTTVITLALLLGCTSKEEKALMLAHENNKAYHKQLQKTEKIQLYDEDITKAVLTATYINTQSSDSKYKPDEVFIVGIHLEEGEGISIDKEGYALTLNGKPPESLSSLDADAPLLKDISFVSQWHYFYLVTFPHSSSKSFTLVFKSELYGKGELHFAKVAKYVLTKEAF